MKTALLGEQGRCLGLLSGYLTSISKKSLHGRGKGISIFTWGQLRLSATCSIIAQVGAGFASLKSAETCGLQGFKAVT
jgi:hypothetical protein